MSKLFKIVIASLFLFAISAHASTGISCLIEAKVMKKTRLAGQPEQTYRVRIEEAKDDTQQRNDFKNCEQRFKVGQTLTFAVTKNVNVQKNSLIWLNYIYGDDRGGARWESYTIINKHIYKERQNGLLR